VGVDVKKHQWIGLSLLLGIILAATSSSNALSQSEVKSWIKRRLTRNAGESARPAVAFAGNNIHVVWQDDTSGNREIYYRRSRNDGDNWGRVNRLTSNAGGSYAPTIAVSGDNIHVVWFDDTPGNREIYYMRSSDNGATWGGRRRLTHTAGSSFTPSIAVSENKVHVVWMDNTKGNYDIYYKRSTDNGVTWDGKRRLTKNVGYSSYPYMAVSGSNIHVVWQDDTPGRAEIYYKLSTDDGAAWGKQKRLTNSDGSYSPAVAVSGSNAHVVWHGYTPGNYEIFYRRSTDNGTTWRKQKSIIKHEGWSLYPSIAVTDNNVHVVWSDSKPGNWELYYKRSLDNGATWGGRRRLTRNAGWSDRPTMVVSSINIHVAWMDDTTGNWEIYYKRGP
jgi:hypothetical protein